MLAHYCDVFDVASLTREKRFSTTKRHGLRNYSLMRLLRVVAVSRGVEFWI